MSLDSFIEDIMEEFTLAEYPYKNIDFLDTVECAEVRGARLMLKFLIDHSLLAVNEEGEERS